MVAGTGDHMPIDRIDLLVLKFAIVIVIGAVSLLFLGLIFSFGPADNFFHSSLSGGGHLNLHTPLAEVNNPGGYIPRGHGSGSDGNSGPPDSVEGSNDIGHGGHDGGGPPSGEPISYYTLVFDPVAPKSIDEGKLLEFPVSAVYNGTGNLAYSIGNSPQNATFSLSQHTFSWIPVVGESGNYSVSFYVSDGTLHGNLTVPIIVNRTRQTIPVPEFPGGIISTVTLLGITTAITLVKIRGK
jgi:hypothetical protein